MSSVDDAIRSETTCGAATAHHPRSDFVCRRRQQLASHGPYPRPESLPAGVLPSNRSRPMVPGLVDGGGAAGRPDFNWNTKVVAMTGFH